MSNNTIEIKINSGGTLEVVTIPVKLYKDSCKAVKLRVKAPKVEGAILKVYGSDRDEAGEEVWTTSAYDLYYNEEASKNQPYNVYEDYIPEEFCQKNGELYLTFGLGMMDGESWTAILTSGTLNLYVSGEGFNFAGVEIPESDKLAYKINKTFENYEQLSANIGRVDGLAKDVADAQATSQSALDKSEEALSKVEDMSATKVLVNGVQVDVFDADTKANTSDLEGKVDKVIGKGLSTYDFDDTAKNKLDGIENGANKTIVDSVLSKTSTNPVQNKVIAEALENMGTGGADLSNYYTKDETYSKTEVDEKIENIQTGGSGDLSDYLSVKGGEMSGDILFKSGNVKFQKTENDTTTNYTMLGEDYVGSNASPLEIRGTEITFKNRPTVNGTEVATVDDIPSGTGTSVEIVWWEE